MRRAIIYLIRKRLGLKKYEEFQFENQKTNAVYCFTDMEILKYNGRVIRLSSVSLNWLLNDECYLIKRGDSRWRE